MKRIVVFVSILALAIGLSLLAFRNQALDADIHASEQVRVGEMTREYRIVVPHDASTPLPVVFAFHGIGDSPESMATYSGLDRLAADHGFILVYPAARNAMWETIDLDPLQLDNNADVRFFDQLLAQLCTSYDIDHDRVYLMGMSNGASFAHLLAAARPDDIAAIVAHSGTKPNGVGGLRRRLPIMLVVGAEDSVSSMMQTEAEQYRSAGHIVEYVLASRLAHEWSTRHNSEMWRFLSRYSLRPKVAAHAGD